MIDGGSEVGVRDWKSLIVRYGNKGEVVKTKIKWSIVGQILAAVQGRERFIGHASKYWEMKMINMEMKDVEFGRTLP